MNTPTNFDTSAYVRMYVCVYHDYIHNITDTFCAIKCTVYVCMYMCICIRISEDFQARLMQQVTDKVKESERLFKEELSLRERRTRDEREREFEEWKRAERQRHEEEMDRVRKPLLEMIEKLQQDKQQVEVSAMEQRGTLMRV